MAMISTRGRYALQVMIDLAEHSTGDYIPLTDITERQNISEKYLESILATLSKHGLLQALRGRGGGYRLSRSPEQYTLYSILQLTENSLSPVTCTEPGATCERAEACRTFPAWQKLQELIDGYLQSVTLADLLQKPDVENKASI